MILKFIYRTYKCETLASNVVTFKREKETGGEGGSYNLSTHPLIKNYTSGITRVFQEQIFQN